MPGHRAVEWLRGIGEAMQSADVSKEKADLMHAIYERITVAGPEIVGVRPTQAAYAHGLALALPEKVEMARPTGFEPATFGFLFTLYVSGAAERDWLAYSWIERKPARFDSAKQGSADEDGALAADESPP